MKSYPCCPTDRPALPGEMKSTLDGKTVSISNNSLLPFDCYIVGNSQNWIVLIYDIFGMHPNKFEFADWVAKNTDLSVAVPDVRRSHNWPRDQYPPANDDIKKAFYTWLDKEGSPKERGNETRATIDYVIDQLGAQSVSLVGYCWGAKVVSLVDAYRNVQSLVFVHPSFLKSEDGEKQTVPTLMMPAMEDNLTQYMAGALRNRHGARFIISENYLGTFHGFMGARGQWNKPEERPYVEKAKSEITQFVLEQTGSAKASARTTTTTTSA